MAQDLILTFHGIGTAPADVPADERPYWIAEDLFRDTIAGLPALARDTGLSVLVTFDDGNTSDLEIGAEVLREHGLQGMFFPCSGRIGQPGYLSADDIRTLHGAGFGIGSHGVDHIPWRGLPAADLERELGQSKEVLSEVLGVPVTAAALPFGAYDRAALGALARHGYTTVFSSDPGVSRPGPGFRYRWSYRGGAPFDIAAQAAQFRSLGHRLKVGLKHRLKSLR